VASYSVRSISILNPICPSVPSVHPSKQLTWSRNLISFENTQPSNRTQTSGPASPRRHPEPEPVMQNATQTRNGTNASMSIQTRNSSRPSPSWKTLIRTRFIFLILMPVELLPLTSAKNEFPRFHRRGAGRSKMRAGVVVVLRVGGRMARRRRRCGMRLRRRGRRPRRSSARGGQKRLSVRAGRQREERRLVG
jgi:hypothetical protein